jgi:hypothetical protein
MHDALLKKSVGHDLATTISCASMAHHESGRKPGPGHGEQFTGVLLRSRSTCNKSNIICLNQNKLVRHL